MLVPALSLAILLTVVSLSGVLSLAAANYALVALPTATFLSYVISSFSILIIGLVMMRRVFPRIAGAFGIAVGIVGTLGGFCVLVPYLSIYLIVSLALFHIWATFSGLRLLRLGMH